MKNHWLDIPLSDYEGHMVLVGQSQMLADVFSELLNEYSPASVAVIGCAGGNGFDRITTGITNRVVGVDINPVYIEEVRKRFKHRFKILKLYTGDIQTDEIHFQPVDLVFAGLLFEHVDVNTTLKKIVSMLKQGGVLGVVLQLPASNAATVTPSPFKTLLPLSQNMQLVNPKQFKKLAEALNCKEIKSRLIELQSGKCFQVQTFSYGSSINR